MSDLPKETKEKSALADQVNMYHQLILNAQKNGAVRLVSLYQASLKNLLLNNQNGK